MVDLRNKPTLLELSGADLLQTVLSARRRRRVSREAATVRKERKLSTPKVAKEKKRKESAAEKALNNLTLDQLELLLEKAKSHG